MATLSRHRAASAALHSCALALLMAVSAVPASGVPRPLDFVGTATGPVVVRGTAVSPDGAHVYVTGGDQVNVFARDTVTNELRFLEAQVNGVGGVSGLGQARGIGVSPDGAHVYAAGERDNAVAVFARDSLTGLLTFVEAAQNGVAGVTTLDQPAAIAFSPDGAQVYVASRGTYYAQLGSVVVFARNSLTGHLSFVETEQDGVGGVDGLRYAASVTVSPDGAHVYASGYYENGIAVFSRDGGTGMLTFVEVEIDVSNLNRVTSLAVSPDGAHVYAASSGVDSVVVYDRDGGTGALTFVEALKDGVGGIDGIGGADGVVVSPDGAEVYVTGPEDAAIAAFTRNALTGMLTPLEVDQHGNTYFAGVGGSPIALSPDGAHLYVVAETDYVAAYTRDLLTGTLDAVQFVLGASYDPSALVVSPDGLHVYATDRGRSGVVVFARDTGTGALTFVDSEVNGVASVAGISHAWALALSPDGKHVYVAGPEDDAVAVFARDATTGLLDFVETQQDGVGGVDGLDDPRAVAVSPDGAHVYVAGFADDAIAVFSRNAGTGALTFVEVQRDGVGGVDGLDGAASLALGPDGAHLYAAGTSDDAVAVFARNGGSGALTFLQVLRDGIGGVLGVASASAVAMSPDGGNVYVSGVASQAGTLAVFARDALTGLLGFLEYQHLGSGGVVTFDPGKSVAVSPSGGEVYVAGPFGQGLSFDRRADGRLAFVELGRLENAVAVSPDGAHVYAARYDYVTYPFVGIATFAPGFAGCDPTPQPGCAAATTGKVRLAALNNTLSWTWSGGPTVNPVDFGDPRSGTHYAVCVYDESGPPTLLVRALAPAGADCQVIYSSFIVHIPCWKAASGGFKYRDASRTPEGVLSIRLKSGGPGKGRLIVRSGKQLAQAAPLPSQVPVRVQLRASSGACWDATYSSPAFNTTHAFGGSPG